MKGSARLTYPFERITQDFWMLRRNMFLNELQSTEELVAFLAPKFAFFLMFYSRLTEAMQFPEEKVQIISSKIRDVT